MHPRLFTVPAFELFGNQWGPFSLHTYGLLLACAFLAGLWLAGRQARQAGLDAGRITDLGVYVLIAGLVGAKLLLVVVDFRNYSLRPTDLLSIFQSGGVFYGGLLGALPVGFWLTKHYRLPRWQVADVMVPGLILGQAIGRLGCFFAGCCYGRPAEVPWAVTFSSPYAAQAVGTPVGSALHPSQLYESVAAFVILAVLLWLAPRKRFHGQVAVGYLVLYSSVRFALEFLRGDTGRGTLFDGALSTSQFIALLVLAACALLVPHLLKSQRVPRGATQPAHP